jgi:hypothetical protein
MQIAIALIESRFKILKFEGNESFLFLFVFKGFWW